MKRRVVVVCGSHSDFSQISSGLAILRMAEAREEVEVVDTVKVEVCSAHRNPVQLRELLGKIAYLKVDVVVMCAGKLAALFGECDAISRNELHNAHTRFIAVPLRGNTEEACKAAYLSAKEVPNSQFIFKEEFWENPETAFSYAVHGKLPEVVLQEQKPPQSLSLKVAYHKGRRMYPERADYGNIIEQLELGGLIHMYTGKTRETFVNPQYPDLLFILATDRISIFDIVMNATIPRKGAVLTVMTVHWLKNVFSDVPNHMVAYGAGILEYLPNKMRNAINGVGTDYLMKNMIVVKRTRVLKVEAIVRGYLTGSGLKDYKTTGEVCGIKLPAGLIDGSELPGRIFTPSTKADYGLHDENIDFAKAASIIGEDSARYVMETSIHLYETGKDRLHEVGIILADTKFEFGRDSAGQIILIDEVLTPDSSRFWPVFGRKAAMEKGETPPSLDKQPVRIAGEAGGIKKDNPNWVPSEDLIAQTAENYIHMISLATGKTLEQFWIEEMGIAQQ